jgi:hypothetical protein
MMPRFFPVLLTNHYERLARSLYRGQPRFAAVQSRAIEILIKKLSDVREATASGVSPSVVSASAMTFMAKM